MSQARKYVVGWKGLHFIFGAFGPSSVGRATWPEAEYAAENWLLTDPGDVVEVYELTPVAAWKCVEAKDGTRRKVKVKRKAKGCK